MLLDLKPRFLRFPGLLKLFLTENQIRDVCTYIVQTYLRLLIRSLATTLGGCFVEGSWLRNAFRWRDSIGPWEERPGHYGDVWNYWTDDGLGYYEFLQVLVYNV